MEMLAKNVALLIPKAEASSSRVYILLVRGICQCLVNRFFYLQRLIYTVGTSACFWRAAFAAIKTPN